jgi:predicted O-methyltransferase YrrM
VAIFCAVMYERMLAADVRLAVRNFYGELRVMDTGGLRLLLHGVVNHGGQFVKPDLRGEPTTYFGRQSGVAHALAALGKGPKRIGVIGLGAGTLAAYGETGDVFRFYEINPSVLEIAQNQFSFLADSPAHIEVVVGDGRLSLERERPQNYDLLVVDAFSGDSIPVHLLSREAMGVYFRHMRPGGLLAVHISNASLDLWPVVSASASARNKTAVLIVNRENKELAVSEAVWAVVADSAELLGRPPLAQVAMRPETRRLRVWTDDYSNLFQILK